MPKNKTKNKKTDPSELTPNDTETLLNNIESPPSPPICNCGLTHSFSSSSSSNNNTPADWTNTLFSHFLSTTKTSLPTFRQDLLSHPNLAIQYLEKLLHLQSLRRDFYSHMKELQLKRRDFPNDDEANLAWTLDTSATFQNPFSAAMWIQTLITTLTEFWRRVVRDVENSGLEEGEVEDGVVKRFRMLREGLVKEEEGKKLGLRECWEEEKKMERFMRFVVRVGEQDWGLLEDGRDALEVLVWKVRVEAERMDWRGGGRVVEERDLW